MGGMLDLQRALRIWHGGSEVSNLWAGGRVWAKPTWTPAVLSPAAWWSFREGTAFTTDGSGVFTSVFDLSGNGRPLTQGGAVNAVRYNPGVGPNSWCRTTRYAGLTCSTPVTYRYMATRMHRSAGVNNRYQLCSGFTIINSEPYTNLNLPVSKNGETESSVNVLPLDGSETIEYLPGADMTFSTVGSTSNRGANNTDWTEVILLATEPSEADRQKIREWLLR